jgi:hypothetical protein
MAQAICCAECSWPLPAEFWNQEDGAPCPGCRQRIHAVVFPAIEQTRSGVLPQAIAADTEASCFYHAESRAVTPCEKCGRFLCGLCDIDLDGKHFCPACFRSDLASNRLETVETHRTLYDTMALALATLPLLLIWPAMIGAPAALFLVIRRWNAPGSILPRTRVRFYLAALFALAELAGVGVLIWAIARLPRAGPF